MYYLLAAVFLLCTLPFNSSADCPLGASYQDPSDCRKYFTCANGVVNSVTCDSSKHFDLSTKTCVTAAPCSMPPRLTTEGELCHFPFTYSSYIYYDCTTENEATGMSWCSIAPAYSTSSFRYCDLAKTPTYHSGDFAASNGKFQNTADYGELVTIPDNGVEITTGMYTTKINDANYQFEVELKADTAATLPGVIYNVEGTDAFNYLYLRLNKDPCVEYGDMPNGAATSSGTDFSGCSSANVVSGQWNAVSVRVYQPNVVHVLVNGQLVTDAIRVDSAIVGQVGLALKNDNSPTTLQFRNPKLTALSPLSTTNGGDPTDNSDTNTTKSTNGTTASGDNQFGIISEWFGDKALYVIIGAAVAGAVLLILIISVVCNSMRQKKPKKKKNTKKKKKPRK